MLLIRPQADKDINVVFNYLSQDNAKIASEFLDALELSFNLIEKKPKNWIKKV